LPVAVNAAGEKLSKQTGATALDPTRPVSQIVAALTFLGQTPPMELGRASLSDTWAWARQHWQAAAVPRGRNLPLE
jgi:glutamyl-Q tRNA(Asp) synthetase